MNSSFKVGKGYRVRLWEDSWCSEVPLRDLFPRLYSLARLKEAKVMEVWENSEQGGGWNLCFERPFNEWEMENVENLIGQKYQSCRSGQTGLECYEGWLLYCEV